MKKMMLFSAAAIGVAVLSAFAVIETVDLDLSAAEIPYVMKAPAGAVLEVGKYETAVRAGDKFQIVISGSYSGPGLADTKSEIESNDVNIFGKYIVNEEHAILYQSAAMPSRPEYHFLVSIGSGEDSWFLEDDKAGIYTEAEARAMLDAAKSCTPK